MSFELTIRKQSVTRKRKIQGLPNVKGNESKTTATNALVMTS